MGNSGSFTTYEDALLKETKPRSYELPNSSEKHATSIYRSFEGKDGFVGYLRDSVSGDEKDEVELDTSWKLFSIAVQKYGKRAYVGFRPFTNPNHNPSERGDYVYITYNDFYKNYVVAWGRALQLLQTLHKTSNTNKQSPNTTNSSESAQSSDQSGTSAPSNNSNNNSINVSNRSNICIFSQNRPEWYGVHMGNLSQSFVTVALYDTLDTKGVAYIISHCESEVIVCEKDKLDTLLDAIRLIKGENEKNSKNSGNGNDESDEKVPVSPRDKRYDAFDCFALKYIIQFDCTNKTMNNTHETVDEEQVEQAKTLGIVLLPFSKVLAGDITKNIKDIEEILGAEGNNSQNSENTGDTGGTGDTEGTEEDGAVDSKMPEIIEPGKDDTAYIMYTSGTTGTPKGVILTHGAFAAMVATGSRFFGVNEDDIYMSYLPLAHIFETAGQSVITSKGGKIAYFQGDIRLIAEDWKSVRPTFLVGVPRVFSKTYDKFLLKKSKMTGVKKKLVEKAQLKSSQLLRRRNSRSKLFDKMVWSKIPTEIGFDKVRVLVSGAAPLPSHIAEFLKIILPKAKVMQGYGMTETCAGGTITDADDKCLGHVGSPADNLEVRLIDAPECDYLTTDKPYPRGEIQIRGLTTMKGYFKNETATKKTLTEEGWINTGDIGRINPNKTISIIDRRKNLFKLLNGEYIASEKVENEYCKLSTIAQCFVYANSHKSFIVGVIVPEASPLMDFFYDNEWITENEMNRLILATEEYANIWSEICGKHYDEVKEYISDQITKWQSSGGSGLAKYEYIKDFYVETSIDQVMQGFTIENECLTPTYKKKRPNLIKRYLEQIKKMYEVHGEPPKQGEHWY